MAIFLVTNGWLVQAYHYPGIGGQVLIGEYTIPIRHLCTSEFPTRAGPIGLVSIVG